MQPVTITVDTLTLRRYRTWGTWIVVSLLTFVFAILCFVAGGRMRNYGSNNQRVINGRLYWVPGDNDVRLSSFRPAIITPIFTGVVVLVFIVASFFLTWGRSTIEYASRSLDVAFGVSLFHMFLLTLLCASSMNGFRRYLEALKDYWYFGYKDSDYGVFVATFAMGYACAVLYFLYALLVLYSTVMFVRTNKDKISSTPAPGLPVTAPAASTTEEAKPASPAFSPTENAE